MALEREMSTPPIPSRSVAQFTLAKAPGGDMQTTSKSRVTPRHLLCLKLRYFDIVMLRRAEKVTKNCSAEEVAFHRR